MALNITRSDIDFYRKALKEAEPYTEEELFAGEEGNGDSKRRAATFAKNILEYYGLSLTDPNDYGDVTE